MIVFRVRDWRWTPRLLKSKDPDATYTRLLHVGCWFVFYGKRRRVEW